MIKEILLLEKEEKIQGDDKLSFISSWCLLPDETLVCECDFDHKHSFVRWCTKEKKVFARSAVFEVVHNYRGKSQLFLLSNRRILSISNNIQNQILVSEWDYETNALVKQTECILNGAREITSIHALENDRFLIKFPDFFAMYDAIDGISTEFNLIIYADTNSGVNATNFGDFYFLEEKNGDLLSFMTEHGFYFEGSWKETDLFSKKKAKAQDLGTNQKETREKYRRKRLHVEVISKKSIAIKSIFSTNKTRVRAFRERETIGTSNSVEISTPQTSCTSGYRDLKTIKVISSQFLSDGTLCLNIGEAMDDSYRAEYQNLEIVILSSAQVLSNGDLLLSNSDRNIVCIDQSKEPVVWVNYEIDKISDYRVDSFIELRNGLILGKNNYNSIIFVWNRKGKLLQHKFLGQFDRIVESDSGSLIYMKYETTFTKTHTIYSETNLVNRCCNAFARFLQEEKLRALNDNGLTKSLLVREDYLERLRSILPLELYELIFSFVYEY